METKIQALGQGDLVSHRSARMPYVLFPAFSLFTCCLSTLLFGPKSDPLARINNNKIEIMSSSCLAPFINRSQSALQRRVYGEIEAQGGEVAGFPSRPVDELRIEPSPLRPDLVH